MDFLKFPPEVRILIYGYLFEGKQVYFNSNPVHTRLAYSHVPRARMALRYSMHRYSAHRYSAHRPNLNNILFTCQEIYAEATPIFNRMVTFSFLGAENFEAFRRKKLRGKSLSRQPTYRCSIEACTLEQVLQLGYDPESNTWLRRDDVVSIKHISISDALLLCHCSDDSVAEKLRMNLLDYYAWSTGKHLNRLILAARAVNISISLEMELSEECYLTTTAFKISSTSEFSIALWTKHSSRGQLHNCIDELPGQNAESVDREIDRREMLPLDEP